MSIKELEVINFQSHIQSYLEFHPGVNIIRGTSHHGKSALIRALRWTIENEPRGAKFRNRYTEASDGVESHISFEEGTISRINRTNFNGYLTNNLTSHVEEEFEALRGDVPAEVKALSLMDGTNIWGQDDGYFLLQESPGNVSRKLNERAGLEDIDKIAKITKNLLDEYSSKIKWAKEELKNLKDKKTSLLEIKKHKQTIEDIDDLFRQLDITNLDKNKLVNRIEAINEIQNIINRLEKIIALGEPLKNMELLLDRRLSVWTKMGSLKLTFENITNINKRITNINMKLKCGDSVANLESLILERTETISQFMKLTSVLDSITIIKKNITKKENVMETLNHDIEELMMEYEDIAECPTCGATRCHWGHELIN